MRREILNYSTSSENLLHGRHFLVSFHLQSNLSRQVTAYPFKDNGKRPRFPRDELSHIVYLWSLAECLPPICLKNALRSEHFWLLSNSQMIWGTWFCFIDTASLFPGGTSLDFMLPFELINSLPMSSTYLQ